MSLSIKLVFANEIHRLTRVPSSFEELQRYSSNLFHYPSFQITYQDEENDIITIACDSDLQTAIASTPPNRSLRLVLSLPPGAPPNTQAPRADFHYAESESSHDTSSIPDQPITWPRHTCDGCNKKPIIGARFHCTVCQDFDFCEDCEKSIRHEHPFMKFLQNTEDTYVNIDFSPENLFESLMKIKDFFCAQKPKMNVFEDCVLSGKASGDVYLRWRVRNCGNCTWPKCSAVKIKGNIDAEFLSIPDLAPGQEGEVVARMACHGGNLYGKWKVVSEHGLTIGKVKAKGFLQNDMSQKIQDLVDLGIDPVEAQELLLKTGGDLEQAVRYYFD